MIAGINSRGALWTRKDWLIAAGLFAATFLSRIPFRTSMLYAWDSVLYTLALGDFDVTLHQPQPPGHIYYVGLIWLVNLVLDEPNSSMVWISVLSSAGAVAGLYWLGTTMFGRRVGALAALLLATSLSFWGMSEVAYPYTLLGLLSIISAAFIYRLWQGKAAWALPSALALGLSSGFRPDLLLFLFPLLLAGLIGKGRPRIAGAFGILALCTALWYVPAALLSGGFGPYQEASAGQSDYLIEYFSIFGIGLKAISVNSTTLWRFVYTGLAAATPLAMLVFAGLPLPPLRPLAADRRFWFLLVWISPSILFYILIHVGEFGYIFSFMPAVLLAASWGLWRLAASLDRIAGGGGAQGRIFAGAGAAMVAANLLLFLVLPTHFAAGRIAARDDILSCKLEAIRKNFDPSSTFIVAVFDYRQAAYYLPEYRIWNFDPAVDGRPRVEIPPGTSHVIVFEDYLYPADSVGAKTLKLCLDQSIFYIEAEDRSEIAIDWGSRRIYLRGESG